MHNVIVRSTITAALVLTSCNDTSSAKQLPDVSANGSATTAKLSVRSTTQWVRTWGSSLQAPESPISLPDPTQFDNQTIRQTMHISIGGESLRVQFSNVFGSVPLHIGGAHLAQATSDLDTATNTDRALTVRGQTEILVPPGEAVISDPVRLDVPDGADVAILMFLPDPTPADTFHSLASQRNYISPTGNYLRTSFPRTSVTTLSWFFVTGIDVQAGPDAAAIVALGDSITDGYQSTVNANHRWPDRFASRISREAGNRRLAVVNAGINGNRTLYNTIGPSALHRFDRDVLAVPGVKYIVIFEGINNLGLPGTLARPTEAPTAAQIINGYETLIEQAHRRGLKIYGATLTPFEDTLIPNYYTSGGEVIRQAVNVWIRSSGRFDAVIDVDAALRDRQRPSRLAAKYDSGDHLHPNDAGYEAIANAISVKLFIRSF